MKLKLDFPSIKCDPNYNPLLEPCKVKLKLKSKFTIWQNQFKNNTIKKVVKIIPFSNFESIKKKQKSHQLIIYLIFLKPKKIHI